jgi:GDP-4-dehydro-6-deoxy-D-mannose reductase
VKLLVTGADGFVGGWLVRRLLAGGHEVTGTYREGAPPSRVLSAAEQDAVPWRALELRDAASVTGALAGAWDAVVHLAALASGADARRDPGGAWEVNAGGTARVAEALGGRVAAREGDPLLLLISTGEVYGQSAEPPLPRREADACAPCSPYAASKLGAEIAAQEVARRTGVRLIIARAFPHAGPGQDARFALPALAARIRLARRVKARAINTGNLDPVRDILDVRDVAEAYLALLERGTAGETYNVASGTGVGLRRVVDRLGQLAGWPVIAEHDHALARAGDLRHLVGDPAKLRAATGWAPRIPLDQTLTDILDAEAD